ncbi:MAG: hypothetical protein ACI398_03780 [Clostridium sp.]
MKKQIISMLTATAVSLTLLGVSANNTYAHAAEWTTVSHQNVNSPIQIDSVYAEYYDFDHPNEYQGQAKIGDTINLSVYATGGVGELTYRYHITKNVPGESYDSGILTSPDFAWQPSIEAHYNVTVYIYDEAGNSTSTGFLYSIGK